MIVHRRKKLQRSEGSCGKGLINRIINKLPIELHIPGYQYCGPGTKLTERLARGDPGINPLDAACKEHDIAYSRNRENVAARNEADKVLADRAWRRVFARDAGIGEKAAAFGIANTMKVKAKFGMGAKRKRNTGRIKKKREKIHPTSLEEIIKSAKSAMHPGLNPVKSALAGAQGAVQQAGGKKHIRSPRVLPVPSKLGGFLPFLIPLFAGLSATGALAGGAAGIAKAVNAANIGKRKLEESKRHNETMEAIALGKGLFLKPHKKGMGLYLKPKNV